MREIFCSSKLGSRFLKICKRLIFLTTFKNSIDAGHNQKFPLIVIIKRVVCDCFTFITALLLLLLYYNYYGDKFAKSHSQSKN